MTEIDHEYTDEIVCPYCGCKYGDCFELCPDESLRKIDCDECKKTFFARADFDITYVSIKKDDM